VGPDFSKASIAQKNKDRIAVNLRHACGKLLDRREGPRSQGEKACHGAVSDKIEVVASMATA